jgi:chromate transporter
MVMVALIGYKVAGLGGAIAVLVAFFLPASLMTFGANRLWHRLSAWPWRESIRRGLAPVTVGLMTAGVISIGKVAIDAVGAAILALVVTLILLTTRVNPALLILGSAIAGWALLR